MSDLARRPDGILVSAETVKDFQLTKGDLIRLRLQDGQTKQFETVPFHYIGVAKEFPTAPQDSFFVANQRYVTTATGSSAVGAFLVQTDGTSPGTVAQRLRSQLGTSAQVTDIVNQRKVIGSNLTAGGLILGTVAAVAISDMLVKVLTGVFDPPPDALSVPWTYLAGVIVLTVGAVGAAGAATLRALRRPVIEELRDL